MNFPGFKRSAEDPQNGSLSMTPAHKQNGTHYLIELNQVKKVYKNAAGGYTALKEIDLSIGQGEFVGIIGRSGSGKSTLINMITGIDRPTSGEVYVGQTAVHTLTENQIARWRGRHLGVVFQFFQLLPTLSVIENVMLPMDFCRVYPLSQRRQRALSLLDMVDMTEQAYKLPSSLSGGQQQRVAIARALANDPQLVIADEPTGNLDSKTADTVFNLFQSLTTEGKTVVMVTHDSSLAQRVSRTVLITDGQVVNEYVSRVLPSFPPEAVLEASHQAQPLTFPPGATILNAGESTQKFFMIVEGAAEVALKREGGTDVVAAQIGPGQFFGEISFSSRTVASMRAAPEQPVQVLAMDSETFQNLITSSPDFQAALQTMPHQEPGSAREAA